MRPVFALSLAMLLAAPLAADTPLIPRRMFFADPPRRAVQLSPDGAQIGWIEAGTVQRASLAAPDTATAWPLPEGLAAANWQWNSDGDGIIVFAVGGEGAQLLVLRGDGGAPMNLTKTITDAPRVDAFAIVAQSPKRPGIAIVAAQARETELFAAYEVDTKAGTATLVQDLGTMPQIWCDAALRPTAGIAQIRFGIELRYRTPGGEWKPIGRYEHTDARLAGIAGVSADGSEVYAVENSDSDKCELRAIDVKTGAKRTLAVHANADLIPAGLTFDPGTGAPQAVVAYFGGLQRLILDKGIEGDFAAAAKQIPGDISFAGRSADDRVWLLRCFRGAPPSYYKWDRTTQKATLVLSEYPALESFPLAKRHSRVVTARDGLKLPIDVYLPADADANGDGIPDRPLPAVLYKHGGPWVGFEWNSWFHNRNFQLLANRGYAVIRTDFRAAAGYGKSFLNAGDRAWHTGVQNDIADIAEWAIAQRIATKGKIALWGWSFGGLTSALGIIGRPDLYACGLGMYGVYDVQDFVEQTLGRPGWEDEWPRRVGDPRTEEGLAILKASSAYHNIDKIAKPLLLTHGERDDRVPVDQTDRFAEALHNAGKDVTYLRFPEEGHDYMQPASWELWWAAGESFLQAHLGGARVEPFGDERKRANVEIVYGGALFPSGS